MFILLMGTSVWGSIAKITAISGSVFVERSEKSAPALLGESLEPSDIVRTDKNSKAQITFNDNTVITVGKQSLFSIEEYLYDNSSDSRAQFNVLSGTIRVMSGKIGKIAPEKFSVKTKTATIGIRGTNFAVNYEDDGVLSIFCLQGIINVFDPNNHKATVYAGSYISLSPEGIMGSIREFITEDLKNFLSATFNFPVVVVHTLQENLQLPVIVDTLQKNLTLPAIVDHLQHNMIVTTLFTDTFEENALPLIAADRSGGILNPDEAFEAGNELDMNDLLSQSGSYKTADTHFGAR